MTDLCTERRVHRDATIERPRARRRTTMMSVAMANGETQCQSLTPSCGTGRHPANEMAF